VLQHAHIPHSCKEKSHLLLFRSINASVLYFLFCAVPCFNKNREPPDTAAAADSRPPEAVKAADEAGDKSKVAQLQSATLLLCFNSFA